MQIVGDALVAVVLVRNGISVALLFALTPWVEGMGIQNLTILTAAVVFVILLIPVPLMFWGKRARISTQAKYNFYATLQPVHRGGS